jgi:hypothetical protein
MFRPRSSNVLPTVNEAKRTRHFIDSRKRSLRILQEELEEHEKQLDISEKAILNVEKTIRKTNDMIGLCKRKIAGLESMKSSFGEIVWFTDIIDNEDENMELPIQVFKDMRKTWAENQLRTNEELNTVKDEMRKLSRHLIHLEEEMTSWSFSHDLAKHSIQHLNAAIESLKEGLNSAQDLFSPKRKVPKEIWALIFEICQAEEMEEHGDELTNTPHIVPLTISHVCKLWRSIAFEEIRLWRFLPAFPNSSLSLCRYGPLHGQDLGSLNTRLTFILHLSRRVSQRPKAMDPSEKRLSFYRRISAPNARHTLHIVVHDDFNNHHLKESLVYLWQIDKVKLSLRSASGPIQVWSLCRGFERLSHLEIEDKESQTVSRLDNLGNHLPLVKCLNLKLGDMSSINFTNTFSVNLIELRIRHNGRSSISGSSRSLHLPALKTLGVVYPESEFIKSLHVPALERLELYPPEYLTSTSAVRSIPPAKLKKILHISFYDWVLHENLPETLQNPASGCLLGCPATALKKMASVARALLSVQFIDCKMGSQPLVEILKSRLENGTALALPQLQKIDFIGCSGITRADFETISSLFSDLTFGASVMSIRVPLTYPDSFVA